QSKSPLQRRQGSAVLFLTVFDLTVFDAGAALLRAFARALVRFLALAGFAAFFSSAASLITEPSDAAAAATATGGGSGGAGDGGGTVATSACSTGSIPGNN